MKDKDTNIIKEYEMGDSCQSLSKKYNISAMTIYRFLKKNNVNLRKNWEHKTLKVPESELSEFQKQVLDGLLLGDGSIPNPHNGKKLKDYLHCSYFTLTSEHQEFANHVKEILPFKFRTYEKDRKVTIINGKEYKCSKAYDVTSVTDKCLNDYRTKWYPNNIKIIPKDLIISPISVKYWFYGDGSTSYINYKNIPRYVELTLCTNNFSISDCEVLIEKLKNVGLNLRIHLTKNQQPVLFASKTENIINFLNYIGKCTLNCFEYKWKYPKNILLKEKYEKKSN